MTSNQLKDQLVSYCNFGNGYAFAITESAWASDVMSYRWRDGFVEYEIKTSRADLLGEIKVIRAVLGLDEIDRAQTKLSHTKFVKHHHYLATNSERKRFCPTKLYFAVPFELVKLAAQRLQDTPYGVWSGGITFKPAKKLVNQQNDDRSLIGMISRACTERTYVLKHQVTTLKAK